jgi:hypothetical protein
VENDIKVEDLRLIESNMHTYLFEAKNKTQAEKGIRNSKENYKIISLKLNKSIQFTCNGLKELINEY